MLKQIFALLGSAPKLTIRNVTTGAPGSQATVTESGTDQDRVIDIQIPAGMPGTGVATYGASGQVAAPKRWVGSQVVASGSSSFTIDITSASFAAAPIVNVQVVSTTTPPVMATVTSRTATQIKGNLYQASGGIVIVIGGNTGASLSLFTGGATLDVTADGV